MKRIAGVVCLGFVVSGCGGSANKPEAAVDSLITGVAQAQCDWEFRCCKDAEIRTLEKARFTDAAGCVSFRMLDLKNTLWIEREAVGAGRMGVDPVSAAACIDQFKMRACNLPNGKPPVM